MIKITDSHAQRLARMRPAAIGIAMGEEIEVGARLIADDAIFSIRDGAISGSKHIASLPGEAPNADTHDLDRSIHVGEIIETPGIVQTAVIADSDHAWIERGGSKMEPRPYLEPAVERQRGDVVEALHKRFKSEVGI